MKHYLYAMKADERDPIGMGDIRSWFNHYKVGNGETFVPSKNAEAARLEEGDIIWFLLDTEIVGAAKVLRSLADPMGSGVTELWYNSDEIKKLPATTNLAKGQSEGLAYGELHTTFRILLEGLM